MYDQHSAASAASAAFDILTKSLIWYHSDNARRYRSQQQLWDFESSASCSQLIAATHISAVGRHTFKSINFETLVGGPRLLAPSRIRSRRHRILRPLKSWTDCLWPSSSHTLIKDVFLHHQKIWREYAEARKRQSLDLREIGRFDILPDRLSA